VNKAKVEPKTVQSILRHAKIQTTLDLYTQDDGDGNPNGAGEIDGAGSGYADGAVKCGSVCGLGICGKTLGNLLKINGGPG